MEKMRRKLITIWSSVSHTLSGAKLGSWTERGQWEQSRESNILIDFLSWRQSDSFSFLCPHPKMT